MSLEPREEPPTRCRARNKRVWASVARDPGVVTEELFAEALRRDPEQRRLWVMRVDGHPDPLKHIGASIKGHGVSVILVLDFIHVLEYLWKRPTAFMLPALSRPKRGSLSEP